MQRRNETESVEVPDLSDLYALGIMDSINHWFYLAKEDYYKLYPILKNYDESILPIYIIYTILCKYYLDSIDASLNNYLLSLTDPKIIKNAFAEGVKELVCILTDLETDESEYQAVYEQYKENFIKTLERKQEVLDFKDKLYTDKVRRGILNYMLDPGGINVDKLGINLSNEETIDLGIYVFYHNLYVYYKQYCHNFIERFKYKKKVEKLDQEQINNLAKVYLACFDSDIFTFEEYVDYVTKRKQYALNLLIISKDQLLKYSESVRKRDEE